MRLDPSDARTWSEWLTGSVGRPVSVRFGRARHQVVVTREQRGVLEVRLSSIFLAAPADVRDDLAAWLRVGRRARAACARLDAWIERTVAELPPPGRPPLRTRGTWHDLDALTEDLLATDLARDFGTTPPPAVTWGPRTGRRARHSLRLGSYERARHLVRIHPVLDQERVPHFFVRYLLFHELLHAALPPRPDGKGRTLHHPPEYRRRERAYPGYEQAQVWQRENLGGLIASLRSGRAFADRAR